MPPRPHVHLLRLAQLALVRVEVAQVIDRVQRRCVLRSKGRVGGAGDAGGDAVCATLYTGGCRRWALISGGAGGDALYTTLYAGSYGRWTLFAGGVEGAGRAGGDALYATLYAGG